MSQPMASPAVRRLRRAIESASVSDRLSLVPHRSTPAARAPFVALVVGILALGVFGLLMFNTQMQQRSFAISRLQAKASALDAQVQGLRIQQQQLETPQHLAIAARRLGMVVPANPTFVSLATGKVHGVPLISSTGDAMQVRQRATPKPAHLNLRPKIVRVQATAPTAKTPGTATTKKKSTATGGASATGASAQGRNVGTARHR